MDDPGSRPFSGRDANSTWSPIEAKAGIDLAGDIDDLTAYLLLLVIAPLREDSLIRLVAG